MDLKSHVEFGAPERVHKQNFTDYLGCFYNESQGFYQPPIDFAGLAKMTKANSHHGTCLIFRRNMAVNEFIPSGLRLSCFKKAQTDLLTFGNAFLQVARNGFGKIAGLAHVPALNVRKGKDGDFFYLAKNWQKIKFKKGEILQVAEYDTLQNIYGVPDWLGGMQSALLNEDATLFRRRYYANGSHLGYILYTNDAKITPEVQKMITDKVKSGKGVGNFKSMHMHIPGGSKEGIQLIPVGDISQKDEFEKIKNISADDVIVAHRVSPALVAVKPTAVGGLGDIEKIEGVYRRTELPAALAPWKELNEQLPSRFQLKFKEGA